MPVAITHRRLLIALACVSYVGVFTAFLFFEEPGLGVGHFYYVPVTLLALAGGSVLGAAGGLVATGFYVLGMVLNHRIPSSDVMTASTLIRFVTFAGIGAVIGWFMSNYRASDELLRVLVERDALTGLPNTRGFEAAITRRLEAEAPFALLLGDMDRLREVNDAQGYLQGDEALRRLADDLGNLLGPDDELTRVGGDEFAILTACATSEDSARVCGRLEKVLKTQGARMTFGWAVYPQDGPNGLSLYRAANERLYARKVVRSSEGMRLARA